MFDGYGIIVKCKGRKYLSILEPIIMNEEVCLLFMNAEVLSIKLRPLG
jgi:hypothetical protein